MNWLNAAFAGVASFFGSLASRPTSQAQGGEESSAQPSGGGGGGLSLTWFAVGACVLVAILLLFRRK